MDPISQIFAQRDGGSAQGAGFGSFFAEGQRLNLSRQHLDLQNRQENRLQTQQNALLKYQEEVLKGQAANVGIQAKINQMQLDLTNASNAFQLELGKLDRLLMEKGARDPEVQQLYGQMIEQNPKAFMVGLGLDIRNSIRGATMLRKELLDSVSIMQEIETKFGRPVSGFNPKTGSFSFDSDRQPSATADIQNQEKANEIRARIATLPPDSPERAAAELELSEFNARSIPVRREQRTVVRPDGTVEIIDGPSASGLTPSQSGTAKLKATRLADTSRRIGELIPKADQIFGPKAAAQTLIVDRVLANLVPGLAEGERIEGRATAGLVIEGLIRSLSEGQGALSNQDVQRLKAKFPELNNPSELIESPARAKLILKSLQKEMARDAYGQLTLIGEKATEDVLENLDPVFLVEELDKGRITREQFKRAIESSPYTEEINQLILRNRKQ